MAGKKKGLIATCLEVDYKEEVRKEISLGMEYKDKISKGQYIIEVIEGDGLVIKLYFVEKITECEMKKNKKSSSKYFVMNENYLYSEPIPKELSYVDRKDFERAINYLVSRVEFNYFITKKDKIDDERKDYLIRIYGEDNNYEDIPDVEFPQRLQEINCYDYSLYQIVSLHVLCKDLIKCLEENDVMCNLDAIAVEGIIKEICAKHGDNAFVEEKKRQIWNSPPTVFSIEETKEIVFNHRSDFEIKLNFHALWDLIKNLLLVIYVPSVLILLKNDYENKLYIYILFAVVYMMALIFSNEKQIDKFKSFMKKYDKDIHYSDLYLRGLTIMTYFLIFTFEIIRGIIKTVSSLLLYGVCNIAVSMACVYMFVFICSLMPLVIINLENKTKMIKNLKVVKNVFAILLYFVSSVLAIWNFKLNKFTSFSTPLDVVKFLILFFIVIYGFIFVIDKIRIIKVLSQKDNSEK
ncbi:hypothetical protein SAMN05216351_12321 [Pseudobutyrivibrio sp. JW11]|uniref:hypothetical protein n=1 Tax=Pseudobutyrivibrio sp. JW11 TaxID=1855302 RepID=UPI0008F2E081|nr:hypothetical protein [Pseudobutyrivibrio sp. JW11]SFO65083.1 hypothetical protein SAMN05216351_12321 [Pseudobutyrivibrio sp. JW11]